MADSKTPSKARSVEKAASEAATELAAVASEGAEAISAAVKPSASQQFKDEASKFGSQAAERARQFAGDGKEKATGALHELAKMLSNAAGDVDEKLGAEYGKYARSAADGVHNLAESLRGKDVDDLLADAGAFVKKSPVVAAGAAAAVGFVLARLVKSGIDAASKPSDSDKA